MGFLVPWEHPSYLLPNLFHGLVGPHREERRYRRLQGGTAASEQRLGRYGKLPPPALKATRVFPLPFHFFLGLDYGNVCRGCSLVDRRLDEWIQDELQELPLCFCSAFLGKGSDENQRTEGLAGAELPVRLLLVLCLSLQAEAWCVIWNRVLYLPRGGALEWALGLAEKSCGSCIEVLGLESGFEHSHF